MHANIVIRAYDDNKKECKEGDMLLIQTKDIPEPTLCKIKTIHTKILICTFDDPIIGYGPKKIRYEDIISATYHKS